MQIRLQWSQLAERRNVGQVLRRAGLGGAQAVPTMPTNPMNDVPSPRKAESEEERSAGVLSKTKGSFTDPKRPARTLPKWAQRPHLKEFTVSRRRGVSAWRRRRPRALGKERTKT